MKKLLPFCLLVLLACFGLISSTLAQGLDDLKIDNVICPNTVTAGTPLDVTVEVTNEGPTPITITRSAVVLSGNPVGSLGGTGVWGPFPRYKTVTVPAYGSKQFTLRIVGSVPTSLKGKIAGAGVTILSDDPSEPNRPQSGGGCLVIVQ
ncbi:MAG: hypothetical protein ABIB41_00065 [Nitrospirota bacterium]